MIRCMFYYDLYIGLKFPTKTTIETAQMNRSLSFSDTYIVFWTMILDVKLSTNNNSYTNTYRVYLREYISRILTQHTKPIIFLLYI